jgi:hypothetical protein
MVSNLFGTVDALVISARHKLQINLTGEEK